MKKFSRWARYSVLGLVRLYQIFCSPDHSFWAKWIFPHGYCKYYPSCSEYAQWSVKEKGLLIGTAKTIGRVLRCNPWSRGGIDAP